jgi:hypothetical protein
VPLPAIAGPHSLSAILLDDDYYSLIQNHKDVRDGLSFANATALIPLKANAWLNLSKRKAGGEKFDSKDIAKHRNDVFRLAGTLPGVPCVTPMALRRWLNFSLFPNRSATSALQCG